MNKHYQFLLLTFFLLPFQLIGQTIVTTIPVERTAVPSLSRTFKNYSLFKINTSTLAEYAKRNRNNNFDFILNFENYASFPISVHEQDILANNYKLVVGSAEGNKVYPRPDCITYAGKLKNDNNSSVSLSITDQLIYGLLQGNGKKYFIEPLSYFDRQASSDIFVVYETKDVVPHTGSCGATEVTEKANNLYSTKANKTAANAVGTCRMVEVAIASDDSMFYRYTTVAGVQDHNISVMNIVVGLYRSTQIASRYLEFKIVGQYVSTAAASNPFTPAYTGFNAETLLSNFRNWGQAGNFGVTYDIGQVWTTKDIATETSPGSGVYNFSVIGLASVSAVCTSYRYQIIEDYSTGYGLGLVVAHETGHNFGASHDASPGYIMAPSIDLSVTSFSSTSTNSFNTVLNSAQASCLSNCNITLPVAEFSSSVSGLCTGSSVTFTDYSVGEVTSRSWDFPDGNPSSSTNASEVVTYTTPGLKTITLTATNATGPSSISKTVFVSAAPIAPCKTNIAGNGQYAIVNSVSLASIRHSNSIIWLGGRYSSYACTDNTKLIPGSTYNVTTNLGFLQAPTYDISNKVELFIDYNNNGSFLDAGDAVFSSSVCGQNNYIFPITIPGSIPVTDVFLSLRIIAVPCSLSSTNGCSIPSNAQIEDYAVYFPGTVPVTLISFNGTHTNGKNELHWSTASENNMDYFNIERSTNETDFTTIATLKSEANSIDLKNYHYTDDLSGTSAIQRFYYRLKIADKDDSYRYSNIITLNNSEEKLSFIVYPNPVTKGETLALQINSLSTLASIDVFNSLGQLIYTNPAVATGNTSIDIPTNWSKGIYMIRITDQEKSALTPLIIK